MDIRAKYHYTYFVYPFTVSKDKYHDFLTRIISDSMWNLKIFDEVADAEIDSHFTNVVKKKMFTTLKWDKKEEELFSSSKTKKKVETISKMPSAIFEYNNKENTKGKIASDNAIFFEISKIRLMCFDDGICFLFMKAEVEEKEYISFNKILDLNYKFRNVTPNFIRLKEYDNIKIQTSKFDNIEDIKEFMRKVCYGYDENNKEIKDTYTNRLFVYSYVCLDEAEWNGNNDFSRIRSEFLKNQYVFSGDYISEFNDKIGNENTYSRWKYSIYGFSRMAGIVFSSAVDHFNFTKLPFYYENVYFYIMLYAFYRRVKCMMLLDNIIEEKNKTKLKEKIIELIKLNSFNPVTNSEHGMILWDKWKETFLLDDMMEQIIEYYKILK